MACQSLRRIESLSHGVLSIDPARAQPTSVGSRPGAHQGQRGAGAAAAPAQRRWLRAGLHLIGHLLSVPAYAVHLPGARRPAAGLVAHCLPAGGGVAALFHGPSHHPFPPARGRAGVLGQPAAAGRGPAGQLPLSPGPRPAAARARGRGPGPSVAPGPDAGAVRGGDRPMLSQRAGRGGATATRAAQRRAGPGVRPLAG